MSNNPIYKMYNYSAYKNLTYTDYFQVQQGHKPFAKNLYSSNQHLIHSAVKVKKKKSTFNSLLV